MIPIPPPPRRKGKNSLEVDSGQMQLVGDSASPGNEKYYGTNSGGTRGYYDLPSSSTTVDTKANILALTPSSPTLALASSDVGGETLREILFWDGIKWYETSIPVSDTGYPVGAMLNNDQKGYHKDYIDGKFITNMMLGNSSRETYLSFRVNTANNPPTLELYYDDRWNRFLVFEIEDDDKLKHKYLDTTYNVWSGDSTKLGINGLPLTNQYQTTVGACGTYVKINGGEE